jgi:signal transduction histidine kinase/CheY-like chemotaxis protein
MYPEPGCGGLFCRVNKILLHIVIFVLYDTISERMIGVPQKSFLSAAKGKIIIGFILAFFALFLAWGVSKIAFNEMLDTVDTISTPNAKLRIVNTVSRRVASLDQQQKNLAFNSPGNYGNFFKESRQLRALLDTLAGMYKSDSVQLVRILSIKRLLTERDKQFINYLKVRERLVNDRSFTSEVQKLNELVNRSPQQQDSTVVTTEKKTSTVTIFPADKQKKPKGFFNRLFGKKQTDTIKNQSFQVTNEEKIKRDTIALSGDTVMARGFKESLQTIEKEQRINSARFLNREAVLANANNLLISQMLDILRKVEAEVVAQIEQNGIEAKAVVNTGIERISFIMIGFFLLTIVLLYLILTDITRSNQYRKELETARDEAEYHGMAKQRFLSNMSHEIRTPLQSIIGYAEIIRTQQHPEQKNIDAIYRSSEHLLQIVNEILDYNRIISGKFTFVNKPFHIRELLDEVISVMQPQAEHKQLDMRTEIELHGTEYIVGDPFRLKQILYNLLSNAIKFTQTGEVVLTVFYKRQAEHLHFTFIVKDTGIGLSEEESSRIFNEFEQIDSPDKEVINNAGAGLGLTIIKSLIENQEGRIYVKSKQGSGSVFTVYLTFTIAPGPVKEDAAIQTGKKTYTKDKVWVVDDDQLILDLCGIIFSKQHIAYACFNSPAKILDADWDPAVKFILMDMRMPELSGVELCKLMRKKIPGDVKIFAMTAQVLPEELEEVLGQGFDGLIMKPFRERDLLSVFSTGETYQEELSDGGVNAEETPLDQNRDFSSIQFDTTAVEKMTLGDKEFFLKILNRFKEDCLNDIGELNGTLLENNLALARLITHRIAGRTAQMGSRKLAAAFREAEIQLAETPVMDDPIKNNIRSLISGLYFLMTLVDEKMR